MPDLCLKLFNQNPVSWSEKEHRQFDNPNSCEMKRNVAEIRKYKFRPSLYITNTPPKTKRKTPDKYMRQIPQCCIHQNCMHTFGYIFFKQVPL